MKYDDDPRVVPDRGGFNIYPTGNRQLTPIRVQKAPLDLGWAIHDARTLAVISDGFRSDDEAIRSLIGDPR